MKEFLNNLKYVWKYAKDCKLQLILYVLTNIVKIAINIIVPILSADIIVSLTNNLFEEVISITIIIWFMRFCNSIVNYFTRYFSQVIYRETLKKIQISLGREILKLENRCIDSNSSGVFIQRLTTDNSKLADIFNILNLYLSNIILNIGIFSVVFIINKIVFLYLIISVFVVYIIEHYRIKVRGKNDKIFRKQNEKVSGFIGELVRGVRDIKMLNAEDGFMRELASEIVDLNDKRYSLGHADRAFGFLSDFFRDAFDVGMIFLLVYLITNDNLTVASALVVHNYTGRLPSFISSLSMLMEHVKDFNISCFRIFSILDSEEFTKEKFGKKHLKKVNGDFEFRNVSFSYKDEIKVLDNLSFHVNANETVAFVGKSGAGKSTIFSLLCKMYDTYSGEILIDGVDIRKLDKDSIRGNITVISQNPYIFNLSVRDNLRLVKEDLTEEEMIDACRMACLHDFIMDLPNGYDTIVGEGGVSLSGGERQRLAIARAFVQKTEIILFDEATSALDNETQAKIQQAIDNLKKNYTILIIAHRLSTVVNSDRILFLNDGKIESSGTHKELLKKNKEYRSLYEAELK